MAFERAHAGFEGGCVFLGAEAEGALGGADLGAAALGGRRLMVGGWWWRGG